MGFLIDTNVISELRKGAKADANVRAWFDITAEAYIFLSVLTLGEIRNGIERLRRRDPASADVLELWLEKLQSTMSARILPVTPPIVDCWAITHKLVLVTRNVGDVGESTGADIYNPFGSKLQRVLPKR